MRTRILLTAMLLSPASGMADMPVFTPVQPELFSDPGGQSNAWGDYDGDGDLDLVVLFNDAPVRLYRNGDEGFSNVAPGSGLPADGGNPRSIAWGDYDRDGDIDLYIGYSGRDGPPNRLYRNDTTGGNAAFTEVGEAAGVAISGFTRQVSFVDYDSDGDLDLYVALRAGVNRLLQNNDGKFSDVTFETGIAEPRRTVGACWFDYDSDGDLDLFTANQNGDRDGLFRNDDGRFSDVAIELDIDQRRRVLRGGPLLELGMMILAAESAARLVARTTQRGVKVGPYGHIFGICCVVAARAVAVLTLNICQMRRSLQVHEAAG